MEDIVKKKEIDIQEIMRLLPHRYPLLLVDRITSLIPSHSVKGIKNVTANEPCFQGHFPGQPIMPGVMPIYSEKMMYSLAGLCGATITGEIKGGLAGLPEGDKAAVLDYGIEFAYQQCKALLNAGVPGVHIYTMDRSKTTTEIVTRLRTDGIL